MMCAVKNSSAANFGGDIIRQSPSKTNLAQRDTRQIRHCQRRTPRASTSSKAVLAQYEAHSFSTALKNHHTYVTGCTGFHMSSLENANAFPEIVGGKYIFSIVAITTGH